MIGWGERTGPSPLLSFERKNVLSEKELKEKENEFDLRERVIATKERDIADQLEEYQKKVISLKAEIYELETGKNLKLEDHNESVRQRLIDLDRLTNLAKRKEQELSILIEENNKSISEYGTKSKEAEEARLNYTAYLEKKSNLFHSAERELGKERVRLDSLGTDLSEKEKLLNESGEDLKKEKSALNEAWKELAFSQNNSRLFKDSVDRQKKKVSESEILLKTLEIDLALRERNLSEAIKSYENSIALLHKARMSVNQDSEKIKIKEDELKIREGSLGDTIKNIQDKEASLEILERSLEIKNREVQERLVLAQNLEKKILQGANK